MDLHGYLHDVAAPSDAKECPLLSVPRGKPRPMPRWAGALAGPPLDTLLSDYIARKLWSPDTTAAAVGLPPEYAGEFDYLVDLVKPVYDQDFADGMGVDEAHVDETMAPIDCQSTVWLATDTRHHALYHTRAAAMIVSTETRYEAVAPALAVEMGMATKILGLTRVHVLLPRFGRILTWSGESLRAWAAAAPLPDLVACNTDHYHQLIRRTVGSHVPLGKNLFESLTQNQHSGQRPVQIFLTPPQSYAHPKHTPEVLAACAEALVLRDAAWYVHAPYVLNLSNEEIGLPGCKGFECVAAILRAATAAGARGVVVHTGQALKRSRAEAQATMITACLGLIEHASEACPLVLETPCGEGTEICESPDDFFAVLQLLWERAGGPVRRRLAYCVDTCHVFAAGYNPLDYMRQMEARLRDAGISIPLRLIHFNDSCHGRGTCKDRHYPWHGAGGRIGLWLMGQCLEWAMERGVDCVEE